MRFKFLILFFLSFCFAFAQQRTVDEVKKSISDLSIDLKGFTTAQTKIKTALTNEASKNLPETWWVAGRVEFGIYDKNRVNKAVGNKAEVKDMGTALINAYDYCQKALSLDTIKETNKDGSPKLDSKTGQQRFKTKFSKYIINKLMSYTINYSSIGIELYKAKQWELSFKALDDYHTLATSNYAQLKRNSEPDSVIGAMRFYQGIAAYQLKKYDVAHSMFADARSFGYVKKAAFDNDLNALLMLNDSASAVNVAKEAYVLYGKEDVNYMRFMINDCLNRGKMKQASTMLDEAIMMDSLNANYYLIKGNIVESKNSYQEAFPYYNKAVELAPDTFEPNFNVGRCLYLDALDYAKKNAKKSPKKLQKELKPIYTKSLNYLEKAHAINPKNIDTISILRDIYYKLGDGTKLDQLDATL